MLILPLLVLSVISQLATAQLNFDDSPTDVATINMPVIQSLDVQCGRTSMNVRVEFDRPYNGVIFSKGHFSNRACRYSSENSGRTLFNFNIPNNGCGTRSNNGVDLYNTVVFQMDPVVQEIWDIARRLTCTEPQDKVKTITFLPFSVGMLDVQELRFGSDDVDCWMELQIGEGPFSRPIEGIVPIGERMTMAIYISDSNGQYDVGLRECYAYDSNNFDSPNTNSLQLTDSDGCPLRPKLMQEFKRTRNTRNSGATMIAYSYINAFKFPDTMRMYMSCEAQICKGSCESKCSPEITEGSDNNEVVVTLPTEPTTQAPTTQAPTTQAPTTRAPVTTRPRITLRTLPTPRPTLRPRQQFKPKGNHVGQDLRYHAFHRHLYKQAFGRRVRREIDENGGNVRFFQSVLVAGKDDIITDEF